MSNTTNSGKEQAHATKGVQKSKSEANIASLLTSEDYFLRLRGIVVMVEEPVHREGVGKNSGKAYSMDVQSAVVSLGDKIVRTEFSSFDKDVPLPSIQLGSVITLDVNEAYMSGKQLVVKGVIVEG